MVRVNLGNNDDPDIKDDDLDDYNEDLKRRDLVWWVKQFPEDQSVVQDEQDEDICELFGGEVSILAGRLNH